MKDQNFWQYFLSNSEVFWWDGIPWNTVEFSDKIWVLPNILFIYFKWPHNFQNCPTLHTFELKKNPRKSGKISGQFCKVFVNFSTLKKVYRKNYTLVLNIFTTFWITYNNFFCKWYKKWTVKKLWKQAFKCLFKIVWNLIVRQEKIPQFFAEIFVSEYFLRFALY